MRGLVCCRIVPDEPNQDGYRRKGSIYAPIPSATLLAGAIAGLLAVSTMPVEAQTPAPSATPAASAVVVQAGSGEAGYAVNLFGPNKVTVPVGATVGFKTAWFEPHTVTFPVAAPPRRRATRRRRCPATPARSSVMTARST
jgi:plastocyanin